MSKNKNETYLNIFIRKEEDKFFERGVILYAQNLTYQPSLGMFWHCIRRHNTLLGFHILPTQHFLLIYVARTYLNSSSTLNYF